MSLHGPRPLDLVALGEPLLEFNQVQAEPPLYLQGFGGDTSNAAIAAARAGARVGYLTRLGEDAWAQRLRGLWQTEDINTEAVISDPQAPTGIYFVSHDAQGHHFSYARAGSAASRMQPQDLQGAWQQMIGRSRWLHVSGISMAISPSACETVLAAMRWAREVGTQVALDSNLRLKLWSLQEAQQAFARALPLCDLFLPSLDDLTPLTGLTSAEDILDWSHAHGARQVVLKLGAAGAVCSFGAHRLKLAGHTVQALDATGAGDCFAGNLLARLAAGDALPDAARYANAAAALAVQGHGAVAPLPRAAAVRRLLEQA
ncbi:MAG: sugar kinase [Betaproteobacteria bacterium]